MGKPMKTGASLKNRQGGAVAVMVGISMVLLVGFLAMVIDLGHLYVAKAGLQNAADAAALSGAKQLNGTLLGVNDTTTNNGAVQWAIAAAVKNNYDFSAKPVDITIADIWVGNCPDDGCMVPASSITTDDAAAGRTFLKVHTRNRDFGTWFAPIWNIFTTSTYGMAVAGPLSIDVSPVAVCVIDKNAPEMGFLRGVTYNLPSLNPISNGDPIWINPADPYPGPCDANHGSTDFLAPFVCTGRISSLTSVTGEVWVNTGKQSAMNGPMNSRFGDPTAYTGGHACDPATAPADINVKEYICTRTGGGSSPDDCKNNPPAGSPQDWMEPQSGIAMPSQQGITITNRVPIDKTVSGVRTASTAANFSDYGALWSYSREKNFSTGEDYTLDDWPTLYGGSAVPSSGVYGYPSGVPYTQTSGSIYFDPPTGAGAAFATANRRVLNVVLIDCEAGSSITGATCNVHLPVLAVGQYFMQRQSNLPNQIFGEFAGLLPSAQLKPKIVLMK